MKTLLITGVSGEIGWQVLLAGIRTPFGQEFERIIGTYWSHEPHLKEEDKHRRKDLVVEFRRLDVLDFEAVKGLLEEVKPLAIIHCAVSPQSFNSSNKEGVTIVDTTTQSAVHLYRFAHEIGGVRRCIFLSTDLVFDGKGSNYDEESPTSSLSDYGRAKMKMEEELIALQRSFSSSSSDMMIIRTSITLTLDPPGKLTQFMLDAFSKETPTTFFTDVVRNVIYGEEIAEALLALTHADIQIPSSSSPIFHIGGSEVIDRLSLVHLFADFSSIPPSLQKSKILSGLSAEMDPARPLDCSLNLSKIKKLLEPKGIKLSGITEKLNSLGKLVS